MTSQTGAKNPTKALTPKGVEKKLGGEEGGGHSKKSVQKKRGETKEGTTSRQGERGYKRPAACPQAKGKG